VDTLGVVVRHGESNGFEEFANILVLLDAAKLSALKQPKKRSMKPLCQGLVAVLRLNVIS